LSKYFPSTLIGILTKSVVARAIKLMNSFAHRDRR